MGEIEGRKDTYSADGVAPVSPRGLACRLFAGAALVCDEVGVEALGGQQGSKSLHVEGLIVVGITYEIWSVLIQNFQSDA